MDKQIAFTALRDTLATLYPEEQAVRLVVIDAGLDTQQVAFSSHAQTNWHNILAAALRQNRLHVLLQVVIAASGHHPALQAVYVQYQQILRDTSPSELLATLDADRRRSPFVITASGTDIDGNVSTSQGDVIEHEQSIMGDNISGDKITVGDIIHSASVAIGRGAVAITNVYQSDKQPPLYVNVPPMPNYFLGRTELVAKIAGQLVSGDHPTLSTEGLPGVGKTTLAIAVAHHHTVLEHCKDGVLWAGLGKQPDVMGVLATWAEALGKDVSTLGNATERARVVKNSIGQRFLLLIIDDAWDIEAAQILRCGGPNCCHLLTTRDQALAHQFAGRVQTETIPVLTDETAYEFLKQLAPEACATAPDELQNLVKAVGGLPIALELLGSYLASAEQRFFAELRADAVAEISDPKQRLRLATQRLGGLDQKQTTLQEIITLSLEGLQASELEAFYALGAFAPKPNAFHYTAATAITGADVTTLAVLATRNLTTINSEGWLSLHQSIADVARQHTPEQVLIAHRRYYLAQINQANNNWQRIEPAYGQLKWAWLSMPENTELLDFIRALSTYQDRRWQLQDRQAWIERGIRFAEQAGLQLEVAKLRLDLSGVFLKQHLRDKALEQIEVCLAMAEELNERKLKAQAHQALGDQYLFSRFADLPEQKRGRFANSLFAKLTKGQAVKRLNKYIASKATVQYKISLQIAEELGDSELKGTAHTGLGGCQMFLLHWRKSRVHFETALHLFREIDKPELERVPLNNLGLLCVYQKKRKKALAYFQAYLQICETMGDLGGIAAALLNIGAVYVLQRKWQEAQDNLNACLDITRKAKIESQEGSALYLLGFVCYWHGQKEQVKNLWNAALAKLEVDTSLFRNATLKRKGLDGLLLKATPRALFRIASFFPPFNTQSKLAFFGSFLIPIFFNFLIIWLIAWLGGTAVYWNAIPLSLYLVYWWIFYLLSFGNP